MATERDLYVIDTQDSAQSLDRVAHSTTRVKEELDKSKQSAGYFATQMNEVSGALTKKIATVTSVMFILGKLKDVLAEGVQGYLDSEKAIKKVESAIRLSGLPVEETTARWNDYANSVERLTGTSGDSILAIQQMMLQMGIAPGQIQRVTDASLRLAEATGQDATTAARQLAIAYTQGASELKKFGIDVDDTVIAAKGFAGVLNEVESRFGPVGSSTTDLERDVNALKFEWAEFTKSLGGSLVTLAQTSGALDALKTAAEYWRGVLSGSHAQEKADEEAWKKLMGELQQAEHHVRRIETNIENLTEGLLYGLTKEKQDEIDRWFVELEKAREKLRGIQAKAGIGTPEAPTNATDANDRAAQEAKARLDKIAEEKRKAWEREKAEQKRRDDEVFRLEQQKFEKQQQIQKKFLDEYFNEQKKQAEKQAEHEKKQAEHRYEIQKVVDEIGLAGTREYLEQRMATIEDFTSREAQALKANAEKLKTHWESVQNDLKSYMHTLLNGFANALGQMLTENHRFTAQMNHLAIQRKMAGMDEAEAAETRAAMEKQMSAQRAAAFLKMTADMLTQIAVQAGVKAVWEGAEAVAAAARYDYASAAQHGTAAGLYAGVAIAAGGTAAIISNTRPFTAEEQAQLDSMQEGTEKEVGSAAGGRGETTEESDAGARVNVYYLGITGQTEMQQAAELERIQREYSNLKTGG